MIVNYLKHYFKNRPMFLGIIRAKELQFFEDHAPLNKKLEVLDFGIGDGFYLDTLFKYNKARWRVTGIDISQAELDKAAKYKITKTLDVYDGTKLPYKNGTFELVMSNCVLEHVSDLKTNLKEISRVLKKGGSFITTVMSKEWDNYLFGSIFLGSFYSKYMRSKQVHKNLLTNNEWTAAFKEAGFEVEVKTGYIDKRAGMVMDILHYISLPSLITYKLFGKWVLMPFFFDLIPLQKIFAKIVKPDLDPNQSAAIFFKLKKS